jgi:hypothetical protein
VRPGAFGDLGGQTHRRESAFDRVRGAQVDPTLGRVAVELEQHVGVIDDLATAFGQFAP